VKNEAKLELPLSGVSSLIAFLLLCVLVFAVLCTFAFNG